MTANSDNRYAHIDAMRALAVMIVVVAHAGLGRTVPGGSGVTIFFTISGFIISYLLLRENDATGGFGIRAFYVRRLLKIGPPLLIAVLIPTLILALFKTINWSPFVGIVFFYFNWFKVAGGDAPLPGSGVVWSLSIEEQFYLGFALIWLLIVIGRPHPMVGVAGWCRRGVQHGHQGRPRVKLCDIYGAHLLRLRHPPGQHRVGHPRRACVSSFDAPSRKNSVSGAIVRSRWRIDISHPALPGQPRDPRRMVQGHFQIHIPGVRRVHHDPLWVRQQSISDKSRLQCRHALADCPVHRAGQLQYLSCSPDCHVLLDSRDQRVTSGGNNSHVGRRRYDPGMLMYLAVEKPVQRIRRRRQSLEQPGELASGRQKVAVAAAVKADDNSQ